MLDVQNERPKQPNLEQPYLARALRGAKRRSGLGSVQYSIWSSTLRTPAVFSAATIRA